MSVRCTVDISDAMFGRILSDLLQDDNTMLEVHNLFYKMCNPYVPMQEGVLAQSVNVTPQYVEYVVPYAHYQYEGIVYGPNFPQFDEWGNIIGWKSPPKKYPTGRMLSYDTEKHPQASRHWDEAMMAEKGQEFMAGVAKILGRRAGGG